MSDLDDFPDEMLRDRFLDDEVIDRALRGHEPPRGWEWFTAFADDVRGAASGSAPPPGIGLAGLLAEGFSTDKGDLLVTAGSNAIGPAHGQEARLPKWRKIRMAINEFLGALAAKLAGLGFAAKAALGLAVAAAATSAAGAAGVLPGPAQNAFADVVETVTPLQVPDGHSDFGTRVSTDAKDGGVDGQEISSEAKQLNDHTPGPPSSVPVGPPSGLAPSGVPVGPPASTPAGPPASIPAGPPSSTPAGPPSGLPPGPPSGVPAGPPVAQP